MKNKKNAINDVGDALGVPRSVMNSWLQHGYLAFFDEHSLGRDDIAFTAGFTVVAALIGAPEAIKVMRQIVEDQPRYWTKALDSALSRDAEVYVLLKRYEYNGVDQLEATLRIGDNLQQELAAFGDPLQMGEQISDSLDVDDVIACEAQGVPALYELAKTAAIPIGKHLAAAMRVLGAG